MTYRELLEKLVEDYKDFYAGTFVIDYWEFDNYSILISYNLSNSDIDKDIYHSAYSMCENIFEELVAENYYESGTIKEYAKLLDNWQKDYESVYED